MNPDRQRRILEDMVRYGTAIASVVRRGRDEFADPKEIRNRATVEHYLELLGESSEAIGAAFRAEHPQIPWPEMRRFRFDSAHPYDDLAHAVNYDEIWRFATTELPRIVQKLRRTRIPAAGPR